MKVKHLSLIRHISGLEMPGKVVMKRWWCSSRFLLQTCRQKTREGYSTLHRTYAVREVCLTGGRNTPKEEKRDRTPGYGRVP